MSDKIPIIIDRSKWRTGYTGDNQTGKGMTALVNQEGYCCCLGFISCQSMDHKDFYHFAEPEDCKFEVPYLNYKYVDKWDDDDFYKNTDLSKNAIEINDDVDTTPEEKELKLLELFADSPFKLSFVGEFTRIKNPI